MNAICFVLAVLNSQVAAVDGIKVCHNLNVYEISCTCCNLTKCLTETQCSSFLGTVDQNEWAILATISKILKLHHSKSPISNR